MCKLIRRIEITKYRVTKVLENPVVTELGEIKVELFEGDNYVYLKDKVGNKLYAEYIIKNDFNERFATKIELSASIELTKEQIMNEVNKKVGEEEFGTKMIQNAESFKYAWNQISEFIQMMIINKNVSFAILDENKKILMSLDKTGQHFYGEDERTFGEMGVQKIDEQNYISFSVEGDYEQKIQNGMAWGITTKSDNKFYPILYIKNFDMGSKNSDGSHGELVLDGCDLILTGIGAGIQTGGISINGDPSTGLYFTDISSGQTVLSIFPQNAIDYPMLYLFDNIKFYRNQNNSNSLKLGEGDKYCLFSDEGDISCNHIYTDGSIYATGYVSGISFQNTSLQEMKENISIYSKSALDEIINTDICCFNYKSEKDKSKKTIGAVIGKNYNCSNEILSKDRKSVDLYSMISMAYKAIQELSEQNKEQRQRIENRERKEPHGED